MDYDSLRVVFGLQFVSTDGAGSSSRCLDQATQDSPRFIPFREETSQIQSNPIRSYFCSGSCMSSSVSKDLQHITPLFGIVHSILFEVPDCLIRCDCQAVDMHGKCPSSAFHRRPLLKLHSTMFHRVCSPTVEPRVTNDAPVWSLETERDRKRTGERLVAHWSNLHLPSCWARALKKLKGPRSCGVQSLWGRSKD